MAKRISTEGLNLILDDTPIVADHMGRELSLSQYSFAIRYNYNQKIFACMHDIYEAAKQNNRQVIDRLKADIDSKKIITSTRADYMRNKLESTITHYHGSNIVVPITKRVFAPIYLHEDLDEVMDTDDGIGYMRALLGTEDEPAQIKEVITRLSGTNRVIIVTPDRMFSDDNTQCAIALGYSYHRLTIYATKDPKIDEGRSRGAIIIP